MLDKAQNTEEISGKELEELNSIEESKGEFFQLKKKIIEKYSLACLYRYQEIIEIKDEDERFQAAKKFLSKLENAKIEKTLYIEDLLKLIIKSIEEKHQSKTTEAKGSISIGKFKIEEKEKELPLSEIMNTEKKILLNKIKKFFDKFVGKDSSDSSVISSIISSKILEKENPIDSLVEAEDQKIFDIPSSEANHTIISHYLWKHADKESFELSVDIIKNQLVNHLTDSYRNELIGERIGLETYMMWKDQLEIVFQNTLGELYPYFQGSSLLAFTESRFEAKKNNEYNAGGYFQITDETADLIQVKKNKYIDERKDPLKSAEGAATYLKNGFNKWYDRGLYYLYKDKLDRNKCIKHTIKAGDTIEKISKKYQVDPKIIIDINNVIPSNLGVGKELIIPKQDSYYITKAERDEIVNNSVSLSLASYNGNIVEDIGNIKSYDEYLEKFTKLLKATKQAGDRLVYIKYRIAFENNDINTINNLFIQVLNIYQSISDGFFAGNYWGKRIKLLEKYSLANLPLEEKKSILIQLIHNKEKNCTEKKLTKVSATKYIKDSLHMKRWFTDVLTQNLLYPANLWAMQKLNENINSGKDKVLQLEENISYHMDAITIKQINTPTRAISLQSIASKLGLDIKMIKLLNPHIKKSVYNLGLELPINLYLPKGSGDVLSNLDFEVSTKKLYRRKIKVDKTKLKKEKREFERIKTEDGEEKFSYTVKNYDSIYDIISDLRSTGIKVLRIENQKGKTIRTNIKSGEKVIIIAKRSI